MLQQRNSNFTPLRSTVDEAIDFEMKLQYSSPAVQQLGMSPQIKHRFSYNEAATDNELLNFCPKILEVDDRPTNNITYKVYPFQDTFISPDPIRHSFPENAPYKSIFAMAKINRDDIALSREVSITFEIRFKDPKLIGGIAFSGYPALGYTIDKFGRTSSNYGLPREMRISIASSHGENNTESEFIDADLHYTKQVINYSSGTHFFHVEPTLTKSFTLQISDFPL
ncbi:MAG: hypothetical protein ACFCAD_03215 [Pleurocapsa sp.]